ncbi:Acyl-protein synthetase, LuxE [Amycolatopsis arida]|uniref:Acyl-protein synthetase, LuxE n=1 Tax=Amycolatopsis arida TaxID=587909 RepID=A0A1I5YKA6_9PSEU|nr:acyl-protein synthetase [Amycolatopsis arida]TDX90578.1 acyl-protein synthetase LuxE [Amycolatopsis arida]SFQ44659.1 Acyl-protein synthetase, LuxE [Amycolatopsis arida]
MSGPRPEGVFTLSQTEREARLLPELTALTEHHRDNSPGYDRMLGALGVPRDARFERIADLPWLPVRLFKTHELKSVPDDAVFKVLTSSGTTGSGASRIHLDKAAAAAQTRHLGATLQTVLGGARLPMLMVDTVGIIKNRRSFSARGAGVLGMANFGRRHVYVLDEQDRPDVAAVERFLAEHGDRPFLIFGFTFMVWRYLYEVAREHRLDLSNGILVHSGGWKKLADQAVDNTEFRRRFAADTGLRRIFNYYGMIEQIGTVFLEGPSGNSLYCPDFADVVIRDPETWREQPVGKPGVIEVVSTLPHSYPGHVLLTEDLGVCNGVDDGDWPGKHFSVLGRLPKAEARGCSDTFSAPSGPGVAA